MTGNVFEFSIEPNAFIEAIRFVTFLLGTLTLLAALVRWLGHMRPWGSFGYVALGMFTSIQELTVLGDPFYPWRLALLVTMNICAVTQMYKDRPPKERRVSG